MTMHRGWRSSARRRTSRNRLLRSSQTTRAPMMEKPWQGGPANRRSSSPGAMSAAVRIFSASTSRRSATRNSPGRFAVWVRPHAELMSREPQVVACSDHAEGCAARAGEQVNGAVAAHLATVPWLGG